MAKCGFKIIPPSTSGGNYTIGINQDQSSFDSTTYTLNINGSISLNAPIYLQKPSNNQHAQIQFHDDDMSGSYTGRIASVYLDTSYANYMLFQERNYSAAGEALSYIESYRLPEATIGANDDSSYLILTDKNAVTIAQGGTGATTTDAAQDALGLTPVAAPCTYTTNTLVTETNFYKGWSCYMMGKLVIAAVNITPAAASSNAYVNIGVVPTLARPLQQVQTRIPVTGSTIVGLRVATNGNISLYKTSNATTAFYTTFCWFAP